MKIITENSIVRRCVAAFVVTKTPMNAGVLIDMRRMECNTNIDKDVFLDDDERVVGTVPAPAGTFEVYGKDHDGELHWLGTEFEGATNPDWVEEFKHALDFIDCRME